MIYYSLDSNQRSQIPFPGASVKYRWLQKRKCIYLHELGCMPTSFVVMHAEEVVTPLSKCWRVVDLCSFKQKDNVFAQVFDYGNFGSFQIRRLTSLQGLNNPVFWTIKIKLTTCSFCQHSSLCLITISSGHGIPSLGYAEASCVQNHFGVTSVLVRCITIASSAVKRGN